MYIFVADIRIIAMLIMERTAPIIPATIKGFRLPHLLVVRSLMVPMNGCMNVPANGPAIQINAVVDFENPRDNRYGYKCLSTINIKYPQTILNYSQFHSQEGATRHFEDCEVGLVELLFANRSCSPKSPTSQQNHMLRTDIHF